MSAEDMNLMEAMSTLRAVRRLKADPIPEDVLDRVLQAAAWAPTGGNAQPWRIVLVQDAAKKKRLGELYAEQSDETYDSLEEKFFMEAYKNSMTPLQVAVVLGYDEIMHYLVSRGANPNLHHSKTHA